MGLIRGQIYTVDLNIDPWTRKVTTFIYQDRWMYCPYSTIRTFLDNWVRVDYGEYGIHDDMVRY